jgi:peptidoglycan/LPS O-acetylase OafA/YrhL
MGLLRFLLAVSVVIAHSSPIYGFKLVGGQIAVQAFFMISGFYMALILNEKYIGENGAYKLFISNRLLRLFPVYWVVLLLTIIFSVIVYFISNGNDFGKLTYYNDYSSSLNLFSLLFLVFSNVFILFQDVVLFLGLDVTSGNFYLTSNFAKTSPALYQFLLLPQAWTIGIEISFYLIVPFLVKMKFKTIILLIILSLLLRLFIMNKGLIEDPWTYRFFPTELVFFLLGMVDYSIYRKAIKL